MCGAALEKYYVTEFNGEEALFYLGNYLPSVNGKEYIYFTTKSEEDYVVTFMENSRFPVTSSSANLSSQNNSASVYEQLDVAEEADLKEYEGLYQEVIDKYMN